MSRYTAVDLSQYPITDILANLGFESYLARDKLDLLNRWGQLQRLDPALPDLDGLVLETEPLGILLETGSYRETLIRGFVNDQIRQLTLAAATGSYLDQIGVTYFRTIRRTITAATSTSAAVLEDDETYRARLALSPESWSVAGPEGAYEFYALSASGDVLDCAVYSQDDGVGVAPQITVVILSGASSDGSAPSDLIATVQTALSSKDVRPLGDLVTVQSATPAIFNVSIVLSIFEGASAATIVAAATAKVQAYLSGLLRWTTDTGTGPVYVVGRWYRRNTITGAAIVPGVEDAEVTITSATAGLIDSATGDVNRPVTGSTANLFLAPRLGTLTVTTTLATGNYG